MRPLTLRAPPPQSVYIMHVACEVAQRTTEFRGYKMKRSGTVLGTECCDYNRHTKRVGVSILTFALPNNGDQAPTPANLLVQREGLPARLLLLTGERGACLLCSCITVAHSRRAIWHFCTLRKLTPAVAREERSVEHGRRKPADRLHRRRR